MTSLLKVLVRNHAQTACRNSPVTLHFWKELYYSVKRASGK